MNDVQRPSANDEHRAPRVAAIDIFRGLTMAVMIFVDDLDGGILYRRCVRLQL
jgi:predicted acyltransferase